MSDREKHLRDASERLFINVRDAERTHGVVIISPVLARCMCDLLEHIADDDIAETRRAADAAANYILGSR